MGKNKDGRRSTKKNSRKNTFNKYGKYTNRSLRIAEAQTNKNDTKVTENAIPKTTNIVFPIHLYTS